MGLVTVLAAILACAWRAGVFSPAASSESRPRDTPPRATATVTRRDIAAVTPVTATLGYAGSYAVGGSGAGTLTWLPRPGRVIRPGHVLYRVDNGQPVVLLTGRVPAWRALTGGTAGADVSQLNHDLVRLGDGSRPQIAAAGWNYFSWATADGVRQLEMHLGVAYPPGSLAPGRVVFAPTALRVAAVTGRLGGPAAGPVLTATSDRHVVAIARNAAQQGEVKAGDKVTVALPSGTVTPGRVASVGMVATTSGPAGNSTTTIPVQVRLTRPAAAGHLDQAPVTVNITTARVRNILTVPVTALLARPPARYVVELVGPGGRRRYVAVQPGIFDESSGLVQVTGALAPGQRVVVAAS
jgi:hypothetical protein